VERREGDGWLRYDFKRSVVPTHYETEYNSCLAGEWVVEVLSDEDRWIETARCPWRDGKTTVRASETRECRAVRLMGKGKGCHAMWPRFEIFGKIIGNVERVQ
jgi:hypothetical protein